VDSAREIHKEMAARQFSRDRRNVRSIRYQGSLDVRGRLVSVAVEFPSPHLGGLPRLYLNNRLRDLPNAVAHVEDNDRICYAREEELVLDPHDPRGSVALCMLKIQEALDRIATGELQDEVAQELPQHWQGSSSVYIDLPPGAKVSSAFTVRRDGEEFVVIAESSKRLKRLDVGDSEIKAAEAGKIPVVLLTTDRTLTFTPTLRVPRVLAELLPLLASVGEELPKTLLTGVARAWPKPSIFLLRAPNGAIGGSLVVPVSLAKAVQRPQFFARLLQNKASAVTVNRFTGVSLDPSFIYHRNMADQPNLGGKKIALVGVGTIGSWLARFLAQSGAGTASGRLILFDEQLLRPGNLGRHWLGMPYIGMNKAVGARKELSRTNPDCDVVAIAESAFKHISMLTECDLVIDATGDQAVSDVLNADLVRARRERQEAPASLHVWLVGSGVAAQAIIADDAGHACYRCLRTAQGDERFRLQNPDHLAALTPANCGEGTYFAYGVGAPAMAAGLALQMCLDWVKGAPSPRLRTIRINHEATFQVKDTNAVPLENCPACAPAHG
jgi:molybdopterin/thiamine biosynthesis adenylyltransferase